MPLDPQAQVFVDLLAAMPQIPPSDERLEEVRTGYANLLLMAGGAIEDIYDVADHDADGVPVRVYRPSPDADLPVIVYFHGGGWTVGTVDQYDGVTRQIANATEAIVVSVDYRLAPEHRYPAALDDCWKALVWVAQNAVTWGGDAARLAVMGDSAGANLAAVCALQARDAGGPALTMQVLLCPVVDCDFGTASYRENGAGHLLTEVDMRWFFSCYVPDESERTDWHISPLRVPDLRGVVPAVVVTAGYDPLRDEGRAYVVALEQAGVAVAHHEYSGMLHDFAVFPGAFDAGRAALERVSADVSRAFGTLSD